jgi:hypothetical protein
VENFSLERKRGEIIKNFIKKEFKTLAFNLKSTDLLRFKLLAHKAFNSQIIELKDLWIKI